MAELRIGVLISGRGSNLAALIEACRAPDFPATIALVISNRAQAPGLEHAARAGIPSRTLRHESWPDREKFDRAMSQEMDAAGVELICLAGFMRMLSTWFIAQWRDRILNIHPSLLPSFRGLNAQRQALDAGVRIAGCSVHFVTEGLDEGPIIAQAAVPVHAGDDEQRLSDRILSAEHRLYPMVVRWFAEQRVSLVREDKSSPRVEVAGLPAGGWALVGS